MSEYQYYDFLAIDRPLTDRQMAELRSISTRAEITATRFCNHYEWGDLKADPTKMVERYFDAFLYLANWGSRQVAFRFPAAQIDIKTIKSYCRGEAAKATKTSTHVVVDFYNKTEEPEDDIDGHGELAALVPVRAQILSGDHRALYVAWLLAVQNGDIRESAVEPPVPAGLKALDAPLESLVAFLHLDRALLAAAAEASTARPSLPAGFRQWLAALPARDKNRWLLRAVEEPAFAIGRELLALHRATRKSISGPAQSRRTVDQLLARASDLRERPRRSRTGRRSR